MSDNIEVMRTRTLPSWLKCCEFASSCARLYFGPAVLLLVALGRLLESAVLLPIALVLPPAHLLLSYEVVVHCWVQPVSPSLMHCIFTALVVFRPRLGLPLPLRELDAAAASLMLLALCVRLV